MSSETALKRISFDRPGEKTVVFHCKVRQSIGMTTFHLRAKSGKYETEIHTEMDVRTTSPYLTINEFRKVRPDSAVTLVIPAEEIVGSCHAVLSLEHRKTITATERMGWLIRYPYGCVEQTTSSVFPQLYLKPIFKNLGCLQDDIDTNIRAGIKKLKEFQNYKGGFGYWPGNPDINPWCTNYAGHFLIEAKAHGLLRTGKHAEEVVSIRK